ncbi:hypothetical protein [Burkholderia cepacia]|uniref:hypothetical protein n=1 Tax=Burkholderia cepacia TaxID=292 RepID=UPI0012D90517|nr:hypothetical protein [Burkholderia cepacia]
MRNGLKTVGAIIGVVAGLIFYGYLVHLTWAEAVAAPGTVMGGLWLLLTVTAVVLPIVGCSFRLIRALR